MGDRQDRQGNRRPQKPQSQPGAQSHPGKNKPGKKLVPYQLKKPVFFIGFMGAGKTSVARSLARMCHISAVDMDTYLERREQKKIKEIFAESGEEGFRQLETEVLKDMIAHAPALISCGGGVVGREENRRLLKDAGFIVYLQVSVGEAAGRISDITTRPLFQDIEQAKRIQEERAPLYRAVSDVAINTKGKGVKRIAFEVKRVLEKEGILCRPQES